jgi:predicted nucleic acid-binding protein
MSIVLLDTHILSELIKLRNLVVQRHALGYVQQVGPIAFSAVTRYEIIRGLKQQNATAQLSRSATFCQNSLVLPIDDAILDRASDLWANARTHGHPHNDADLIVASTALEHRRVLVTGNTRHFDWIPGLKMEDWRTP